MMKILYSPLIIISAYFNAQTSQVGINTKTPQQTLHVAGATSTVLVNGLSKTSNTAWGTATDPQRVYSDTNGNLVLQASQNTYVNTVGATIATANITSSNTTTATEASIASLNFTLPQESIVYFHTPINVSDIVGRTANNLALTYNNAIDLTVYYLLGTERFGFATFNTQFRTAYNDDAYIDLEGKGYTTINAVKKLPAGNYTIYVRGNTNASNQFRVQNSTPQAYIKTTVTAYAINK